MTTEKAVNYTDGQVAIILASVPFNIDMAKLLAEQFKKGANGHKSVIAKVINLQNKKVQLKDADGIVMVDEKSGDDIMEYEFLPETERPFYIAQPAYKPKTGKPVEKKADIVATLSALLSDTTPKKLESIDKAPKAPLEHLRKLVIATVTGDYRFDSDGYDRDGYDIKGFNDNDVDKDGFDYEGFDAEGIHRDSTVDGGDSEVTSEDDVQAASA